MRERAREGERQEVKEREKGRKKQRSKKGGYYNYAVLHKKNQTGKVFRFISSVS